MARKKRIKAEQILDKAYEMVLMDGLKSITARKLATELDCSTQPIYLEFGSMDHLKNAVLEEAKARLVWYVSEEQRTDNPLVNLGMGYMRFATIEPQLYRALFIDNHFGEEKTKSFVSQLANQALRKYEPLMAKSETERKRISVETGVIIAGIATLLNTSLVTLSEDEVFALLTRMLNQSLNGELVTN